MKSRKMTKNFVRSFTKAALGLAIVTTLGASLELGAHAVENPLFGYTHLLPSPFTLPTGRVVLGTTSGIGITDFLEVDTDIVSDAFQIYNATARLSLLDFPGLAAGVFAGYQYTNLNTISSSNPSLGVSSILPGAVVGVEVVPDVAVFVGGNLFYSNTTIPEGVSTSGYLKGAEIETDASWAYNPHKNQTGNVLSAGFTYNTTFDFYGVGVSHHWKGFHLGIHYYPNATNYKVYPIVSGGAVVEL